MKNLLKTVLLKIYNLLVFLGFNPFTGFSNLKGLGFYYRDLKRLKEQKGDDTLFPLGKKHLILDERHDQGGTMKGHYFHQDLHVAKRIFERNPNKHVDIGSRTDGFVAHVACFREIEVFDIRNIDSSVENIRFTQADLTKLPDKMLNYCDSISSLHAIEHFGLGRYNDPIDYFGYRKAIENIAKIVQPGGVFYLSLPIGPQRIEFNAHRVFSLDYLLPLLQKNFDLNNFSYVDDAGNLHENIKLNQDLIQNNLGCNYGCGIFDLVKR